MTVCQFIKKDIDPAIIDRVREFLGKYREVQY
jgi:hypothetical protein